MEFDDTGTEIRNTEWQYFFPDPTLTYNFFFDPKVIYDSYDDRFILVVLYMNPNDYSDSRVLVSFSNSIIGSNALTWNHYEFKASDFFTNTRNNNYWFDYPNLGINKDELFITLNVFNHPQGLFQKPFVLQIKKIEGYNNAQNLSYNNYTQIFSGSDYAFSLLPLSDGLQSNNYTNVMYFVNNSRSPGSSEMWWRKLTGSIQDGNSQINTQDYFTSTIFYNVASYASQKGENPEDRIKLYDNRLLSGFYKDSILHFVFHSSDHGWMQIVYETFDLHNNSATAYTHGGLEDLTNYLYPSITCMNTENNPNDKVIINYNRTSPDIYIQLDAIDFQNGKWGCNRVIKLGKGLLDLSTYDGTSDTYERLGDYISIQRKYDSNEAWLVGSYPFGNRPNENGATDGLNAWISKVNLAGFWINQTSLNYTMFPNPNNTNELHFIFSNNSKFEQKNIIIKDVMGIKVFEVNTKNNTINLPYLKKGIYFVKIITKNHHYESKKLIIN